MKFIFKLFLALIVLVVVIEFLILAVAAITRALPVIFLIIMVIGVMYNFYKKAGYGKDKEEYLKIEDSADTTVESEPTKEVDRK